MDRSDFQMEHSAPEGRLPGRGRDLVWISHDSLRTLSTHAIPDTPGSRSTTIPTTSGEGWAIRSGLAPIPQQSHGCPVPRWNVPVFAILPEARHSQGPPPERGIQVTTLHVGSFALRPARLRRRPKGALVGRLRRGGLPPHVAPHAIGPNRFLSERDLHPQAYVTIMAHRRASPL